jgi:hypothetical protein
MRRSSGHQAETDTTGADLPPSEQPPRPIHRPKSAEKLVATPLTFIRRPEELTGLPRSERRRSVGQAAIGSEHRASLNRCPRQEPPLFLSPSSDRRLLGDPGAALLARHAPSWSPVSDCWERLLLAPGR